MTLLPSQLVDAFRRFPIRSQDGKGENALVVSKFFDPAGRYTFFVTGGSPVLEDDGTPVLLDDGTPDWEFFGFCLSPLGEDCDEWGYGTLAEFRSVRGRFGLGIERDTSVVPGERTVSSFLSSPSENHVPDTNS